MKAILNGYEASALKKAEEKGIINTAKNMLKKGMNLNTIGEVTGLSKTDLIKQKNSL